jgi:hypothetical protein
MEERKDCVGTLERWHVGTLAGWKVEGWKNGRVEVKVAAIEDYGNRRLRNLANSTRFRNDTESTDF